MRRFLLTTLLAAAAALVSAGAQNPEASPVPAPAKARLFALNLFALAMDVQWGDEGTYPALGLFARTAARGALVDPGIPRTVLFRRAGLGLWSSVKGPDGKPLTMALDPGQTYALVVRPNGNGDLVKIAAPDTDQPKVLLVNAARGPAALLRLGISDDGQAPGWTAFADSAPGVQTLTWAWTEMPAGTDFYQPASAQPGQPATTNLKTGRWYVGVVAGVNGQVFDITP